MTLELSTVWAVAGVVFGAGGAWAIQVYRGSSNAEGLRELVKTVAQMPTATCLADLREDLARVEAGLREEVKRVETQVAAVSRHVGNLREEVAEQRGRAGRASKESDR